MSINLRTPTVSEIFSSTAKIQLLQKQSVIFVNETLKNGGVIKNIDKLPITIKPEIINEVIIQKKMAGMYIANYLKNNWPALLIVFGAGLIVSGAIYYNLENQEESI
jgi:hypothetical protein